MTPTTGWRGRAVAALLVLAAAGCAGPGQAPADLTDLTDPTAALLQPGDLPAGYRALPPEEADRPVSSTRPECSATLDAIELDPPADPGVREARAFYGDAGFGRIRHVVRAYPDGQAAPELDRATATLAMCGEFELTYVDGVTVTLTVVPRPAPDAGETAWAADIRVDTGSFSLTNRLVLLRVADRTASVSVLAPEDPDPAIVEELAERAADRLVTVSASAPGRA